MKKSLSFLFLVLVTSVLVPRFTFGQGVAALKVISMPGFPDLPADSAFEGQSYGFDIVIFNNSNIAVNSTMEIVLKVDSIETTIFSSPAPGIQPGDTLTVSVGNYIFEQAKYQAGNNIVVVWPRVSGQVIPIDTFYTDVFFIPLNSLGDGIQTANELSFKVYPVPAVNYLGFAGFENKAIEYVRITSVSGQVYLQDEKPLHHQLFIGSLPSGTYLIEAGFEGKCYRSKFLKQ